MVRSGFWMLFFIVNLLGSSTYSVDLPPDNCRAQIRFKHIEYDFGDRVSGDRLSHRFAFKNNGNCDLHIEKIESTCSCTAALSSDDIISPGDSGSIEVIFETGNRTGLSEKQILVFSDDPDSPITILTLHAFLQVYLAVDPVDIHYGRIRSDEIIEKQISITGLDIDDVKIDRISVQNSNLNRAFSMQIDDFRPSKANRLEIRLILDPSKIPGTHFRSNLRIECSGSRIPFLEVGLFGETLGVVYAEPSSVILTEVSANGSVVNLEIISQDGIPFRIESANVGSTLIDSSFEATVSSVTRRVRLIIPSAFMQLNKSDTIELKLNHPRQTTLTIPISSERKSDDTTRHHLTNVE